MRSDHRPPKTHRATTPVVVAIDGPSGAGKSTVARALARELGFVHLDTGAMYRAVAVHLLARGVDPSALDDAAAEAALETLDLTLTDDGAVRLDGGEVETRLRAPDVEAVVSRVAALAPVRARLVDLQRAFATRGSLVCEGRDMGSVVFPDAAFKFYLDASVEERARRRQQDFAARGRDVAHDAVRAELATRDARDASRELAPLTAAPDAERVDTTGLGVEQVVARLARAVRDAVPSQPGGRR